MNLLESIQNCGEKIYNPLTNCYDYYDGTFVSAEVVDNTNHINGIFIISSIRDEQRKNVSLVTLEQVMKEMELCTTQY